MIENTSDARSEDIAVNGGGARRLPAGDEGSPGMTEALAGLGDKLMAGAHQAQAKLGEYGERIVVTAGDAKAQLKALGGEALAQAQEFGGEAGAQARSHPLILIGFAVLAGALIARIGRG